MKQLLTLLSSVLFTFSLQAQNTCAEAIAVAGFSMAERRPLSRHVGKRFRDWGFSRELDAWVNATMARLLVPELRRRYLG